MGLEFDTYNPKKKNTSEEKSLVTTVYIRGVQTVLEFQNENFLDFKRH